MSDNKTHIAIQTAYSRSTPRHRKLWTHCTFRAPQFLTENKRSLTLFISLYHEIGVTPFYRHTVLCHPKSSQSDNHTRNKTRLLYSNWAKPWIQSSIILSLAKYVKILQFVCDAVVISTREHRAKAKRFNLSSGSDVKRLTGKLTNHMAVLHKRGVWLFDRRWFRANWNAICLSGEWAGGKCNRTYYLFSNIDFKSSPMPPTVFILPLSQFTESPGQCVG